MFKSLRRIDSSEAGAVRPRRLAVVTVRPGDTVETLSARMAFPDARRERFMVLNGLGYGEALVVGQKVKLVTY